MPLPRCEATPLPGHQVAFSVDGVERVAWHYGAQYPRPFFFPLRGPSGAELTRMGHPGAPNHEHHRSIWFSHKSVTGVDFWGDSGEARIRQHDWLAYEDGDEALMGVLLRWQDGHDPRPLLEQRVLVSVRPAPEAPAETLLEVDTTFTPTAEMLELGQTNFGFFAVRVAKSISAYFGDGQLTNDQGAQGEPKLFGKPSRWMDYSGSVRPGGLQRSTGGGMVHGRSPKLPATSADRARGRQSVTEGITFFDHPANPRHPAHWHVREDGWMGASMTMNEPLLLTKQSPLRLRYLLHAHAGPSNQPRAESIFDAFASTPALQLVSGRAEQVKHRHYILRRQAT